jgi:hypothetical protein
MTKPIRIGNVTAQLSSRPGASPRTIRICIDILSQFTAPSPAGIEFPFRSRGPCAPRATNHAGSMGILADRVVRAIPRVA